MKSLGGVVIKRGMTTENFFVPYTGKKPASVYIKGHRLVILAPEREVIEEDLELLGADRVKKVTVSTSEDQDKVFSSLARQVEGGVVIAPAGVGVRDILKNLESELPWIQ